jgi:hypothetical protein
MAFFLNITKLFCSFRQSREEPHFRAPPPQAKPKTASRSAPRLEPIQHETFDIASPEAVDGAVFEVLPKGPYYYSKIMLQGIC